MRRFVLLSTLLALFLLGLSRAVEASSCAPCRKIEDTRRALETVPSPERKTAILAGLESLYTGLKDWETVKDDHDAKADFLRQYILLADLLMRETKEPDPAECLLTISRRDKSATREQMNDLPEDVRRRVQKRLDAFQRRVD